MATVRNQRRDLTVGLLLLLAVVVIWVASSELTQVGRCTS